MSRQEAASQGRRPMAPGEEGKGSGPVEPDALTTGAGAAAEERIAIDRGGERPPPFSRAPGPGAIAIAARSGSRLGGNGPGVVLTTGSGSREAAASADGSAEADGPSPRWRRRRRPPLLSSRLWRRPAPKPQI